MNRIAAFLLVGSVSLTSVPLVLAHHSAAAFDTRQEVKATGTVTQFTFRNPHVYLTLLVKRADGSTAALEVEAGAASVLNPLGFNKNSIAVGEVVTIVGNPARVKPDALMLGRDLYKADGAYYPLNIASRSVYAANTAAATSIAGTWFSPWNEFNGFNGAAANWPLTDAGKAALARFDPKTTPQKDCVPVGVPTLMFYPVADTITVERDRVVMKIDWMNSERSIFLDGRKHPPASETFLHGRGDDQFQRAPNRFDDDATGQRAEARDRTLPRQSGWEVADLFRRRRRSGLSHAAGRVVGAVDVQTEHASLEREVRPYRRA